MDHRTAAYVLGVSTPNGVGVLRSLERSGIPLVAADHLPGSAGLGSRFARSMVVPDPSKRPEAVLEALMAQPQGGRPVLFPTSDAFVLFLSRYRDELGKRYAFGLPSRRILEGMVDKRRQYEEAMRVGAPLPPTFFPTDMDEVQAVADRLDYPAFIKPYPSHLWYEQFGNKGFKVGSREELKQRFEEVFRGGHQALVQTVIQGPNTNHVKVCAYYGEDGRRHALFLTRKIRQYPAEFGVGTLMESFHDEEVQRIGSSILEAIGYRGIGSVELKLDDRTGRFMMIDLRPRLWVQNVQATYAGVNFPLIQYLDVTGQEVPPEPEWEDGVRWLDPLGDMQSFWWYRQRKQLGFIDLLRSWSKTDCFAYLTRRDPMMFLRKTHYGIEGIKLVARLLREEVATSPRPSTEASKGASTSPSDDASQVGGDKESRVTIR